MSRRKVILPSWAASSEISKDIVALNERFPNLSKGELIINTKEENVTLTTLDEAGKVSNFISEDKIDEKITDVSRSFNDEIKTKQDAIEDLDSIRSGAALGATALQEVPEDYATKEWVEDQKYLTVHQDISGKQDVINDLDDIRSGAALGASALQEVPSDYAKKSDIPSIEGYATEVFVTNAIAEAKLNGNIEIVLSGYTTKEELNETLNDYAKNSDIPTVPTKVSELENDSKFITIKDIPEVTIPTKVSDLENDSEFITIEDIPVFEIPDEYAKKTDIPSLEGLATEEWVEEQKYLTEHQSLSAYSTTDEVVEMISGASAEITSWVEDQNYLTEHQSLEGLATEEWVEGKGYLTEHQDISHLATKGEIPSLSGYATESWAKNAITESHNDSIDYIDGEISKLVGNDTDKTIRTIANEELVARLVTDGDSGLTDNIKSLKDIANWLEEHPENAAAMNSSISTLSGVSHTHANKNILDNISSNDIHNWNNPTYATSAKTSEMLQCVMSDEYGTYEGSIKFDVKNVYAETHQLELDVDTNINFKKTACFENNIHLGKNATESEESLIGGAICFGDDFHSVDGESYPMTYIKEEEDNVLDIVAPEGINLKSTKLSIGDNLSINGSEILLLNNTFNSDGSEDEVIFHTFIDDEGVNKIKIGVGVDAWNIKANNVPNSVKINGVLKPVVNGSVDLGDLINSANTAKIADEAKYVAAKDIDGILGVEHLPIGITSGSVASGDHTHVEIDGRLNVISGSVASLFTKTDENAEHIEDQGLVLQQYNETLTNHEGRIQTAEATSLSNESRLDAIENDVLVLKEKRDLKVKDLSGFYLTQLLCLTQAPDTIWLGKINGNEYITPKSNLNGATIVNESFVAPLTGSVGYKGFCNTIHVKPESISIILINGVAKSYLISKVILANCTLPSNSDTTGVTKPFGLMRSNIQVQGITGLRYYSYAIYPGDTIAIPLNNDNLIPSNFKYENEIGEIWYSGDFTPENVYFLNGISNLVLLTKLYDYDIYASYGQEITGTMDDTNLSNDKNVIIDNIEGVHKLYLPETPNIGKKYDIISKWDRCTLNGGGKLIYNNYEMEPGAHAGFDEILLTSKITSCIYDGSDWYLYKNL